MNSTYHIEAPTYEEFMKILDKMYEEDDPCLIAGNIVWRKTKAPAKKKQKNPEFLLIFVPAMDELVKIECGTGENLLKTDRADGYVDYINWDRYAAADIGLTENCLDGGMLMLKEYVDEKYTSLIDAVPEILRQAYSDSFDADSGFTVLSGGGEFKEATV